MTLLVVSYSRTGNNDLLARHLSQRLHADHEDIRPKGWRTALSLMLDMAFDRRPKIASLQHDVAAYDHVLFVAPLWDMNIAHPMQTALLASRGRLRTYDFVTLCGYHRAGQADHVRQQLQALTGQSPRHVVELQVADLLPPSERSSIGKVTPRRVQEQELATWAKQIDDITGWFSAPNG